MKYNVNFERYSEPNHKGSPTFGIVTIDAETIEEVEGKAMFRLSTKY